MFYNFKKGKTEVVWQKQSEEFRTIWIVFLFFVNLIFYESTGIYLIDKILEGSLFLFLLFSIDTNRNYSKFTNKTFLFYMNNIHLFLVKFYWSLFLISLILLFCIMCFFNLLQVIGTSSLPIFLKKNFYICGSLSIFITIFIVMRYNNLEYKYYRFPITHYKKYIIHRKHKTNDIYQTTKLELYIQLFAIFYLFYLGLIIQFIADINWF